MTNNVNVIYIYDKYQIIDTNENKKTIIPLEIIDYYDKYKKKSDSITIIFGYGYSNEKLILLNNNKIICDDTITTKQGDPIAKGIFINKSTLSSDTLLCVLNNQAFIIKIVPILNYIIVNKEKGNRIGNYIGDYFEVTFTNFAPYFQ